MAFKHISANRLSFLLTSDGVPSGFLIGGENIPVGSLAIDRINAITYQLQPNLAWIPLGSGNAGTSGNVKPPSEVFEQLITASTSAPFVYYTSFNPVSGSVKVFVNGLLAIPSPITSFDYTLSGMTITWANSPSSFQLDPSDIVVVYYSTLDF